MKTHGYRVGTHDEWYDDADVPGDEDRLEAFTSAARRQIEPWLSAVFQSEHLNLLLGSGFTTAIGSMAGAPATTMATVGLGTPHDDAIGAQSGKTVRSSGASS